MGFKQLHSPYQLCLLLPQKVLLNITEISWEHTIHIQVKWKIKINYGQYLLEVKQWWADHLHTVFTTSALHLPTVMAVMETKHHKCYKVQLKENSLVLLFLFFKCMLGKQKKKKASTGSQLWMEKNIFLNCNQKTIYECLFQKLFLLTRQPKEWLPTYGTSLSTSSQQKNCCLFGNKGESPKEEQTTQGFLHWHLPICLQLRHSLAITSQAESHESPTLQAEAWKNDYIDNLETYLNSSHWPGFSKLGSS